MFVVGDVRLRRTRNVLIGLFLACWLAPYAAAQSPSPVPEEYQDLHAELTTSLESFEAVLDNEWNGSKPPVVFSAHLASANGYKAAELFAPGYYDNVVLLEMEGLKALGIGAITIDLSFPILSRDFHETPAEYQQYLDFYTQLAGDVRTRGMKLIVDSQVVLSQGTFSNQDVAAFYDSLSLEQYQNGRAEVIATIAQHLRPDYLSVLQEPDSEALQAGKPEVGTVEGSTALLGVILNGLATAGVEGIPIGAGVGTWQASYIDYIESYAATSIDFIDVHLYPVQSGFLSRALEIADTAKRFGKDITMTESWLYKARESELAVISYDDASARNVFSFWQSLDARYLQMLVDLAYHKEFKFIAPFWSGYFRGYIEYGPETAGLSAMALHTLANTEQRENTVAGSYSLTGMSYLNAILSFPDVTPPSPPGDLSSQTTASSANLSWSPSTDDIGTAGYQLSRADSAEVNTTALTSFFDPNLTDGRTYVYTVRAFDASGNMSASASLSTTTPDRTAPSVPAGLQAAPLIVDSRVNITVSWSPATDNVGVDRYTVLHGLSADSLTQIAVVTDPSFSHLNLQPLVTYYYAVEAVDGTGNKSAPSEIVSVTTPAVPDVTPPGALILYPAQGAVVRGQFDLAVSTYDPKAHRFDAPSGVAGVRVIVDGMDVAVTATEPDVVRPPFSLFRLRLDARSATVGVHVISVEVRDEAGNTRRSPGVTVIVRR